MTDHAIDWTAEPDPYMRQLLNIAPPLSNEQRTALAELLKPVRISAEQLEAGAA